MPNMDLDAEGASTLSPDAQATLLLCGRLQSRPGAATDALRPLSGSEYSRLAKALLTEGRRPADLLRAEPDAPSVGTGLDRERLRALLDRGMALALAVERWGRLGIRVLGRGDPIYPAILRKRLQGLAPPLLFVCGRPELLQAESLCIVGSRDATADGLAVARRLGEACAADGAVVLSGAARGVDCEAMCAALQDGGRAAGIVSDSLARMALARDNRDAILGGRLVLASSVDPEARFHVANAMERNKYLYALSRAAVVVDSDVSGGTWSGACENAKHRWVPAYVRLFGHIRAGNCRLAELGLLPLPEVAGPEFGIRMLLGKAEPPPIEAASIATFSSDAEPPAVKQVEETTFEAFVGKALTVTEREPRSEAELVQQLGFARATTNRWLKQAVARNLMRRHRQGRRVLYGQPSPLLL